MGAREELRRVLRALALRYRHFPWEVVNFANSELNLGRASRLDFQFLPREGGVDVRVFTKLAVSAEIRTHAVGPLQAC